MTHTRNKQRVTLQAGQTALLGYGSLLSKASLETTLKRSYDGPFLECSLPGWRRTWDVAIPNTTFYWDTETGPQYPEQIIYLNISPDPESNLNAVLFVVSAAELAAMDTRESVYYRLPVTEAIADIDVVNGDAYIYVANPKSVIRNVDSPLKAAIRLTYIEIVETGLQDWGPQFRTRYELSTDTVPPHLVFPDQQRSE